MNGNNSVRVEVFLYRDVNGYTFRVDLCDPFLDNNSLTSIHYCTRYNCLRGLARFCYRHKVCYSNLEDLSWRY